jgi:hypothetical protein
MTGDIALAGFLLTAEEWQSLDSDAQAQLAADLSGGVGGVGGVSDTGPRTTDSGRLHLPRPTPGPAGRLG